MSQEESTVNTWKRNAEDASVTARTLEEHLAYLNLKLEDLKGKSILILGPGKDFAFEKAVADAGAEVVVALAYSFAQHESPADVHAQRKTIHPIKGLFQELPPAYESFDLILSLASFPMHLYNYAEEDLPKMKAEFSSVVDLLASGGEARLSPVNDWELGALEELKNERSEDFSFDTQVISSPKPFTLVVIKKFPQTTPSL